jgi:uncharacterized protein
MLERSQYFSQPDALLIAALIGDLDAAIDLLRTGANPNQQDEQGQTALMIVINEGWGNDRDWLEALVSFGADINALDSDGDSALDLARYYRRKDFVAILETRNAIAKAGPSGKELRDDSIYRGFAAISAGKLAAQKKKS